MTNKQNALICRTLAGYEVQVSPAGKHYIVTDDGTRPLPDFDVNEAECTSTADALCRSRNGSWCAGRDRFMGPWARLYLNGVGIAEYRDTWLSALAHCLLQIAEGE
jgi:hypothetical protein